MKGPSPDLTKLFYEPCVDLALCLSLGDYERLSLGSWEPGDDLTVRAAASAAG